MSTKQKSKKLQLNNTKQKCGMISRSPQLPMMAAKPIDPGPSASSPQKLPKPTSLFLSSSFQFNSRKHLPARATANLTH